MLSGKKNEKQNFALIDLDEYTFGDRNFRKVLIGLMIENILELNLAFHHARIENMPELFRKACHKVKITLHMLNYPELLSMTDELQHGLPDIQKIKLFDQLCFDAIEKMRINSNTEVIIQAKSYENPHL